MSWHTESVPRHTLPSWILGGVMLRHTKSYAATSVIPTIRPSRLESTMSWHTKSMLRRRKTSTFEHEKFWIGWSCKHMNCSPSSQLSNGLIIIPIQDLQLELSIYCRNTEACSKLKYFPGFVFDTIYGLTHLFQFRFSNRLFPVIMNFVANVVLHPNNIFKQLCPENTLNIPVITKSAFVKQLSQITQFKPNFPSMILINQ